MFDQYLLEDLNSLKLLAYDYLGTLPLLTAVFEMCLLQQACIGRSMAAQITILQEWIYVRYATAAIKEAA